MSRNQKADPKQVVRAAKRKPTPTLAAIGAEFGVTRERVRQILRNAGVVKPKCTAKMRAMSPARLERLEKRREEMAMAQFAREAKMARRLKAIVKARAGGATWKQAGQLAGFDGQQPGTSAWQFFHRHSG